MKLSVWLGRSVIDSRGKTVFLRGSKSLFHRPKLESSRSEIDGAVRIGKFLIGFTINVIILIVGLGFISQLGIHRNWGFLVLPPILLSGLIIQRQIPGRQYAKWLMNSRVQDGRCAGCGFKVSALNAKEDGCTVCPECGAAWKLESTDA